jgi:hypothetical protein
MHQAWQKQQSVGEIISDGAGNGGNAGTEEWKQVRKRKLKTYRRWGIPCGGIGWGGKPRLTASSSKSPLESSESSPVSSWRAVALERFLGGCRAAFEPEAPPRDFFAAGARAGAVVDDVEDEDEGPNGCCCCC